MHLCVCVCEEATLGGHTMSMSHRAFRFPSTVFQVHIHILPGPFQLEHFQLHQVEENRCLVYSFSFANTQQTKQA